MFRKINKYFTYRRNRKLAEREMARIAVLILPTVQEISNALQLNYSRMIEILTYIAGLSPDEIQKILVHAMAETMPE